MRLLDFVSSLIARFSKNTVLEDIRITKSEIESNLIPAFHDSAKFFGSGKFQAKENTELSTIFYRNFKAPANKKQPNIIVEIDFYLKNVLKNLSTVEAQIEALLEEDVLKDGLTAKKALLVRAAEYFSFISRYSIDLLVYVTAFEAKALQEQDEANISLLTRKWVENELVNFAVVFSIFAEDDATFKKYIDETPDVVLNAKTGPILAATYSEAKLDPQLMAVKSGFQGSPIYHFRLLIAEWQADRYKASKDKKKMLELRLLNLKMLQEKNPNPKLEKEIEYIQNRIETIEYKMKKMED